VQRLLAGAEGREAEAFDGRYGLVQESGLLVEGQPRQQGVDALGKGRCFCGHVDSLAEAATVFEALRCS